MLKPFYFGLVVALFVQPPSGGCVLKQEVAANQAGRAASRLQAAVC